MQVLICWVPCPAYLFKKHGTILSLMQFPYNSHDSTGSPQTSNARYAMEVAVNRCKNPLGDLIIRIKTLSSLVINVSKLANPLSSLIHEIKAHFLYDQKISGSLN